MYIFWHAAVQSLLFILSNYHSNLYKFVYPGYCNYGDRSRHEDGFPVDHMTMYTRVILLKLASFLLPLFSGM